MIFQQPFDYRSAGIEPAFGFPLVPAGDYPMVITDSQPEPTKDGTGGMLVLQLEVINHPQAAAPAQQNGQQHAGHKVKNYLNLYNANPQTVKIAYQQLAALCAVTGIQGALTDSSMLHNKPFIGTLNNDGQFNNLKQVKDINGNVPGKAPAGPVAPTIVNAAPVPVQAPVPGNTAPPWQTQPPQAPPQPPAAPTQPWQQPTAPPANGPGVAPPWATGAAPTPPVWKP